MPDTVRVRHEVEVDPEIPREEELLFEKAGPRQRIFFDPAQKRAAVVTCGGLCPGINSVIRSLFLELDFNYRVTEVLGPAQWLSRIESRGRVAARSSSLLPSSARSTTREGQCWGRLAGRRMWG